jgi:predicted nuclease of predicted toxin-antitoxin system
VWVRLGNCRKSTLVSAFDSMLVEMQAALQAGNRVLEIR